MSLVKRGVGGTYGQITNHTSDILFTFVLEGAMTLRSEDQNSHALRAGDAFVIPPYFKTTLFDCSPELELLEVALPGNFETIVHPGETWP